MASKLTRILALALSIAVIVSGQAISNTANRANAVGSLSWHVKKARDQGKLAITLGPTIVEYAELEPLDAALQHNGVIVATLLRSETTHDERNILTWRKYRIDEVLAKQARTFSRDRDVPFAALVATAPKSFLPLQADEFLTEEIGGSVNIDGVKIIDPGEGSPVLPVGSKYLMFLLFAASGKLAIPSYGPACLFAVDRSNVLHTRIKSLDERNPLLREIRKRTDGSLAAFRSLATLVLKPR